MKKILSKFYLDKEKDIILKHMWPVTFFHFPKYRESYLVTIADKICSSYETIYKVPYVAIYN